MVVEFVGFFLMCLVFLFLKLGCCLVHWRSAIAVNCVMMGIETSWRSMVRDRKAIYNIDRRPFQTQKRTKRKPLDMRKLDSDIYVLFPVQIRVLGLWHDCGSLGVFCLKFWKGFLHASGLPITTQIYRPRF